MTLEGKIIQVGIESNLFD